MNEETKKMEYLKEFKVMIILIFSILGFLIIDQKRYLLFAIITSILLIVDSLYILKNELGLSKHIFNLIISLFNVTSLFFMIQYFIGDKTIAAIYKYAFYPFINEDEISLNYVIWIFLLTMILLLIQNRSRGVKSER